MIRRSNLPRFLISSGRFLPVMDLILSVGLKRLTSVCQLVDTEVGATTSEGPLEARSSMMARDWIVLPSPMSSARQPPTPQWVRRANQLKPSS